MHVAGMKNWFHYVRSPDRQEVMLRASHIMHNRRFWAILAVAILTALIVGFGIWASMNYEPMQGPYFSPYLY